MTGMFTISMMPCVMAVPSVFAYTIESGRDFSFLANAGYILIVISVLHPIFICRYVYVMDKSRKPETDINTELHKM